MAPVVGAETAMSVSPPMVHFDLMGFSTSTIYTPSGVAEKGNGEARKRSINHPNGSKVFTRLPRPMCERRIHLAVPYLVYQPFFSPCGVPGSLIAITRLRYHLQLRRCA